MKAVVYESVGGPEVLKCVSIADPTPGPGEVRVRVRATSLNRIDWYLRKEDDDAVPMPHILGADVAGIVEKVGTGVTGWSEGDEVVVWPGMSCGQCRWCQRGNDSSCESFGILGYQSQGGYAELTVVPARNLLSKPRRLSFEEAASVPLVFTTAYHQLVTRGGLHTGDTVLVMGGSSGIGSAAIQISKTAGARVVTTVGSAAKVELARQLGADFVVQHNVSDWPEQIRSVVGAHGVDLVCEHFGGDYLRSCIGLLAPLGRLVTIGYTVDSQLQIDLSDILSKQLSLSTSYVGSRSELAEVLKLMEWGAIRPVVARVFPLEEARAAHELFDSRDYFGKIVLSVAAEQMNTPSPSSVRER